MIQLKKGDKVVMIGCIEAGGENEGKIWECEGDSFKRYSNVRSKEVLVVFLKGYSGGCFYCDCLHKLTVQNSDVNETVYGRFTDEETELSYSQRMEIELDLD